MPVTKVLYGQSLSDLCAEENVFLAADLNGIGITDALVAGVILSLPVAITKTLSNESIITSPRIPTVMSVAGQTWVDMAMQMLGDEERLFELCDANNAGITDDLAAETTITSLLIDDEKVAISNLLSRTKPSSLYFGVGNPAPGGIEFWAIEIDFEVS